MKLLKYKFLLIVVLFLGCEDDFLVEYPTAYITPKQITDVSEINPGLQSATVAGIYENMFKVGADGYDDSYSFAQKAQDIFTDMLAGDMVLAGKNYGWYSEISELTATTTYTSGINYRAWRYYFRIINLANIVIDGLGGDEATPETTEGKHFMGQALAMRAYGYLYLSQFYADKYDPNKEILPIYRDTATPNQAKSKTSDVFALMISDLTTAISLLSDYTRGGTNEVNADVANGLLAYVYAQMGDYANAKSAAAAVVTGGNFSISTADEVSYDGAGDTVGGFNDVSAMSGAMWGTDLTVDNGIGLYSFWGKMDIYSYSYAWAGDGKVIDVSLYSQIAADDIRLDWWLNSPTSWANLHPIGKFYDDDRVIGGQRTVTADYIYMRVAEMYLLHAEASAKTGDEASAKTSLKALLAERVGDSSYVDALSGQALLDEIYLQTRIEMWGEGKSYFAMKRNQATITRGANWLDFAGDSFSYDDDKLTYEIPEAEIRDNPLINDQN